MKWKAERKFDSEDSLEDTLEAYFRDLAKDKSSSTLWCSYSMLKSLLRSKHNVDIGNYTNVLSFLKSTSTGYIPKKSKVLTEDNIEKFLKEAPDYQYLLLKVVLILGICGACRTYEITNLTMDDLEIYNDKMIVNIKGSKTRVSTHSRMFVVQGEMLNFIHKYKKMRPDGVPTNRFLLSLRNGKCVSQVVGKNRIALMAKDIATYLGLPNPEAYSGSCFRRSSMILTRLRTPLINMNLGCSFERVAGDRMEDSMEIQTKRMKRSASIAKVFVEEKVDTDSIASSQIPEKEAELGISDAPRHNSKIKIEVERFSEGENDESMGNESEKTKTNSDREADKYFKGTMENNIEMAYEMNPDTPAETFAETPTETPASSAKNPTQSVHQFNLDGKTIYVTFNNCTNCNVTFKVEK